MPILINQADNLPLFTSAEVANMTSVQLAQIGAWRELNVSTGLASVAYWDGEKAQRAQPDLTTPQSLTANQKAQGRGNFGVTTPRGVRFAFLGDSRTAQMHEDSASNKRNGTSTHFFNWANALIGGSMVCVYNGGVSGKRTDEYIANLPAALAADPDFLVIGPPAVNDISQGYTAVQVMAQIDLMVTAALAQGVAVILVTEPGANALSAAYCKQVMELNDRLQYYAESKRGVYLFDITRTLWDPDNSTSVIALNSAHTTDGTHFSTQGCYAMGVAFQSFISGLIFTKPAAFWNATRNRSNDTASLISNPLFVTQTGGTKTGSGTLASGAVPGSWTLNIAAGISVALTYGANAEGFGSDLILTITASNSGVVRLSQDASSPSSVAIGSVLRGFAEVAIDASPSGFTGVWSQVEYNDGSTTYTAAAMLCGSAKGAAPAAALTYALTPAPLTVAALASGWITQSVRIDFSAAGSAVVRIRKMDFRIKPV